MLSAIRSARDVGCRGSGGLDAAKYDALIVRLEALAGRRPIAYTVRVLAVALSGFAILALPSGSPWSARRW